MKRYGDLWSRFATFDNFYEAYIDARRGKKYKAEVMEIGDDIEKTIWEMLDKVNKGEWKPDKYRQFESRTEVKRRIINAPAFRDRIMHHALCNIVHPLFERKFIYDSYACRSGKGTHKAVKRVQQFIRKASRGGKPTYVLQCDISKYYQSINHDILEEIIRRTVNDKKLLTVWDSLIEGFEPGLPIGALTSQMSANIYLNIFDHFAKECIGAKYYLRYMDDFIFVENSKKRLREILADTIWFMDTQLRLKLNPKTKNISNIERRGFCGI